MRANRRRDTRCEVALRRELHRRGLRFVVDAAPPGTNRRRRADVLLRGERVALFVDGCFWHSCPQHLHLPRANREWWRQKLASVVARDRDTDLGLQAAGWLPLRVWEHEPAQVAAARVLAVLRHREASGRTGPLEAACARLRASGAAPCRTVDP
ncbi:very short patch repair endonuclease [uncultured Pseudokineococcus sp.]|uniref:very short patch repair endonuclease n=1 Tax=uncultured Pseudokineococcus sp. TaxID=1642928 RepID=UPI003423AEDE